jgi:hypothetical protein
MLLRPETKSILPSVGVSKGSHASCVGETWTRLLMGRKFDSVSSLSGRSVCKHMSAYETNDHYSDQGASHRDHEAFLLPLGRLAVIYQDVT